MGMVISLPQWEIVRQRTRNSRKGTFRSRLTDWGYLLWPFLNSLRNCKELNLWERGQYKSND